MAAGSGPRKRPSGQRRSTSRRASSRAGGGDSRGPKGGGRPSSKRRTSTSSSGKPRPSGQKRPQGNRSQQRSSGPRKPRTPTRAERSGWGSVARHGAAGATIGQRRDEEEGPRTFSPEERTNYEARVARRAKQAERMEGLRDEARAAIGRSEAGAPPATNATRPVVERRPLPGRAPKPRDVHRELVRAHGQTKGDRAWSSFKRAASQFGNEQFADARKTLRPLVDQNPSIAELRELYGLALYRLGRWDDAIDQLESFRSLSGTAEQHPVLMDAHRANGHWADVDELWAELGETSPAAELVTEGRIVFAGSLADRGDLQAGIRALEKGWRVPKRPAEHHIRRAYALADLHERAGNVRRSVALFGWIDDVEPAYGDVPQRLRELGR